MPFTVHLENRPWSRFNLPPYGHYEFSPLHSAHEYALKSMKATHLHVYVHVRC